MPRRRGTSRTCGHIPTLACLVQEQRLDGVPLEEQNARDVALEGRMQAAMRTRDGRIEFREHLLPMEATPLCADLTAAVRLQPCCGLLPLWVT